MANGDKPIPTANVERPLSKQAQAAIEAHYVEIVDLKNQRDSALAENERAKQLCVSAGHKLTALEEQISDLKGRCTAYQLERDEAVAKFAKLEGFFISVFAQMRGFNIPNAPKQTVAPDAEAPALTVGASSVSLEQAFAEELNKPREPVEVGINRIRTKKNLPPIAIRTDDRTL